MKIEQWDIAKIKPYSLNAKTHKVESIKNSMLNFKIDQPIVVDSSGVVIKGHGRLKAAQELGLETFPVVVRDDLTPEQIRLSRLADNRSSEGGYDSDILQQELQDLYSSLPDFNFDDLGLSDSWLEGMVDSITPIVSSFETPEETIRKEEVVVRPVEQEERTVLPSTPVETEVHVDTETMSHPVEPTVIEGLSPSIYHRPSTAYAEEDVKFGLKEKYTRKVKAPIYEIRGDKPSIVDLVNTTKSDKLIEKINDSGLPQEQKDFLIRSAYRHDVFDFGKIAEYYAHSEKEMQEHIEDSTLVIVDMDKAIEQGFSELSKVLMEQFRKDHMNDET